MQQEQQHVKGKYLILYQMNIIFSSLHLTSMSPSSLFLPQNASYSKKAQLAFFSSSFLQPKHTNFLYIFKAHSLGLDFSSFLTDEEDLLPFM